MESNYRGWPYGHKNMFKFQSCTDYLIELTKMYSEQPTDFTSL